MVEVKVVQCHEFCFLVTMDWCVFTGSHAKEEEADGEACFVMDERYNVVWDLDGNSNSTTVSQSQACTKLIPAPSLLSPDLPVPSPDTCLARLFSGSHSTAPHLIPALPLPSPRHPINSRNTKPTLWWSEWLVRTPHFMIDAQLSVIFSVTLSHHETHCSLGHQMSKFCGINIFCWQILRTFAHLRIFAFMVNSAFKAKQGTRTKFNEILLF